MDYANANTEINGNSELGFVMIILMVDVDNEDVGDNDMDGLGDGNETSIHLKSTENSDLYENIPRSKCSEIALDFIVIPRACSSSLLSK